MSESVRVYVLVESESPAIRPYIEQEEIVGALEAAELTRRSGQWSRTRYLTREELLAAPETSAEAEALRTWRAGDNNGFDEDSAFLVQSARAKDEEEGREIQGG